MERFSYSRNGNNGLVDQNCQVQVKIPAVETHAATKRVFYQIHVTNLATRQSWNVSRRFSEFLKVRNELLAYFKEREGKKCPGCVNYEKVIRLFEFPRKHVFTSVSQVVLNYRKVALRSFVALLASHTFTEKPKCPTCSGFAFSVVQDFLTQELKAAPPAGLAPGPEDAMVSTDAIRESIDVKRFMGTQHPVSQLRPVDSNGKFTVPVAVPPRKQPSSSSSKARASAKNPQQQPRINTSKRAASDESDLPSPPHSSTGSSSSSFSSLSSPAAAAVALPMPMSAAARRPQQQMKQDEPVEDDADGEGSFVSFTAGVRPKRTASRASRTSARRSRNRSISSAASAAVVIVQTKKKSEKKRLNFTRRRSSAAASPRHSTGSADGGDNEDEINMDFLKISQ